MIGYASAGPPQLFLTAWPNSPASERLSGKSGLLPSRRRQNPQCLWWKATLEIGPHPALSETQAKVIALDYGMRGGKAKIKVRRALLYYALRRLGLDTDPGARKPQDQQIVLLNREVIHEDHG